MFTMAKIKASRGKGRNFYHEHLSANDYYSEKETIIGRWKGELSWEFGLNGHGADERTFSLFQQNINPKTERKLTQRTNENGVRFYDFQCSAQKSVSVMALFDDRLVEAHRRAVDFAMGELENLAATRIRKGENTRTNNFEYTGNIIYAQFHHDASRSLDPQLHAHNVVVNVTKTTEDGETLYKALETAEMCRAIRYAGKAYQNYMASECRRLGYETYMTRDDKGNIKGFEIEGVSEEVLERFSKRRVEIEKEIEKFKEKHGRSPTLDEVNSITRVTRGRKMVDADKEEVIEWQKSQLSPEERSSLEDLSEKASRQNRGYMYLSEEAVVRQIKEVVPALFEREGVLRRDKILAEALNRNLGRTILDRLKAAVKEIPELQNLGGGKNNEWYSTKENIERELYAVETADGQKNLFPPVAEDFIPFKDMTDHDYSAQAEVVRGILTNTDRFALFRGVAGSGKTSTLRELCAGLKHGGQFGIHLIAPTNSAVDVLREEGFERSQTVASFLMGDEKPPRGSHLIVDESGLNSLKDGVAIMRLATELNYRVLFVGDARQHNPVDTGDFFRLLEAHSQIKRFELTLIHRQKVEEYRNGVSECAMGDFKGAFERFDKNGFIREGKADYLQKAADSYCEFTDDGRNIKDCIAVAPTHAECDTFTEAIRTRLKEKGYLAKNGHEATFFRSWQWPRAKLKDAANYTVGQTVFFAKRMGGVADAGETALVEGIEGDFLCLSNGQKIYTRSAAEFVDVGEAKKAELCMGDLVQFTVNMRKEKIYNGMFGVATGNPGEIALIEWDGKPGRTVTLKEGYAGLKYGWVTTSHKAQGKTAKTVVVAAETLDKKTFYVSMSRGREGAALHCPDKEHLSKELERRGGDRTAALDLVKSGEIRPIELSPPPSASEVKAATLPQKEFLTAKGRLAKFNTKVLGKCAAVVRLWKDGIKARFARAKRIGIVSAQTTLEKDRIHAIDVMKDKKGMDI